MDTASVPETVPVVAVILAAGQGSRFDPSQPKQLVSVGKREVIDWSIRAFERNARVSDIVVVVNNAVRGAVEKIADRENYAKLRMILNGGEQRSDSVSEALAALSSAGIPPQAKLLVHDASRPFVTDETITECVRALNDRNAVVVAEPSDDAIAVTRDSGDRKVVEHVVPREEVVRLQTPQAFRFGTLSDAYRKASEDDDFSGSTNDASVLLRYAQQEEIGIVEGSVDNMAIVTVHDVAAAEDIAKAEALTAVRAMIGKMNTTGE
jgi:2-C-methyl-D-erythritol 4-phosphate cytidylyltransferase